MSSSIFPSNCDDELLNGWLELRRQIVEAEPFDGRGSTPGISRQSVIYKVLWLNSSLLNCPHLHRT